MKKLLFLALIWMMTLIPMNVYAENEVHIYWFHSNTCHHCQEESIWLEKMQQKYANIVLHSYEVGTEENYNLMQKAKELYGISGEGVPFTVIGGEDFYGYNASFADRMEKAIITYSNRAYDDLIGSYLNGEETVTIGENLLTEEEVSSEVEVVDQNRANQQIWIPLAIVGGVGAVSAIILFLLYQRKKRHGI